MGDAHVGLQARLMSQALRKLTSIIHNSNAILLFINQVRQTINGMSFGPKETTTGGKALKFYASVRIEIKRVAQIKKGEEVIGARTKAKIVKNKVAAPFKVAEFDIMYNEGVSLETDLINLALKVGILKKKGTYIQDLEGNTLGQGLESARKSLRDNPETLDKLYTEVLAKEDASIATEDGEDDLVANTVEE